MKMKKRKENLLRGIVEVSEDDVCSKSNDQGENIGFFLYSAKFKKIKAFFSVENRAKLETE